MAMCNTIVPRMENDFYVGEPRSSCECVLPCSHSPAPHVFRLSDGRHIAWQDDYECNCCEPGDPDRCFVYWEISEENVQKLKEASS